MPIRSLFCLSLVALLVGCSGGPDTQTVTGTITYDGQPVADAQVGFIPVDGQTDVKPASGRTDSQGNYTLTTYVKPGQEAKGAMVGNYKVTVTKGIAENRIVEYEDIAQAKEEIPSLYADAGTTTLSAAVTAGGENKFDFTLRIPE